MTRQSVADAIKAGKIIVTGEGRAGRIDTEEYKTIQYLKNMSSGQRRGKAENLTKEIVKRKALPKKREVKPVKDDIIEESEETVKITVPKDNGHGKEVEEILELAQRLEEAKTEKMEQQAIAEKLKNAARRGELVEKEAVYNSVFLYLDKLNSNLERLADSYLSDMGPLIIDAGAVLPEHRTAWKDEVMGQIDGSKTTIVNRIREIEREQAR